MNLFHSKQTPMPPLRKLSWCGFIAASVFVACRPSVKESVQRNYLTSSNAIALPHAKNFVVDTRLISRVFLEREFVNYVGKNGSFSSSEGTVTEFAQFERVWSNYMTQVTTNLIRELKNSDDIYGALKRSIDATLPKLVYNADHTSIVSPLVDGRTQCRSGTWLYIATANEIFAKADKQPEKATALKIIYLDTHMLPAIISGGDLIGFEMTKRGTAKVNFGPVEKFLKSGVPVRIVDAEGAARSAILNQLDPKAVVRDTVPKNMGMDIGGNSSLRGDELYGFASGRIKLPKGDIPLDSAEIISSSIYSVGGMIQASLSQSGTEDSKSLVDLKKVLSPDEFSTVKKYLAYNQRFDGYWDTHAQLVNDKELPKTEKLRQLDVVIAEALRVWEGENVAELYRPAQAILSAKGLYFTQHPAHTIDAIRANRQIIAKLP